MTLPMQQLGVESLVVVEIDWANEGGLAIKKYAERAISAISATGDLVSFVNVSKQAKITGQGGVSKSASVVLDDTAGLLKTLYDTKDLMGSRCKVYQYFTGSQSPAINQLLMSGSLTSDIEWSEGERTLSFSIEEGSATNKSSDIGYAPETDAYLGFNNGAVGQNWPLVFGTAVKVPAVRVEYNSDLKTVETYDYTDDVYEIENGSELPQDTPIQIEIDRILFEGSMSGDTLTLTGKNLARYQGISFLPRPSDDEGSPAIAYIDSNVKLRGLYVYMFVNGNVIVNYCKAQTGEMVTFNKSFGKALDETDSITQAARWPRITWDETYESYNDNNDLVLKIGKDAWEIRSGAKVIYVRGTPYTDRYICNLIPSTAILEVWGRRRYFNSTIWAKVPSSYYTIQLDLEIETEPGTVTRNVTAIEFATPLSEYECEGWEDVLYVTLTSSVAGTPQAIVEYVIDSYTTYSRGTITSIPVSMDFAYFETTDAIEFLQQIAWQCASVFTTQNDVATLAFLPTAPVSPIEITTDEVIMKTLKLKSKTAEDISTKIVSNYVISYDGLAKSSKVYSKVLNNTKFGVQVTTQNMFALTCPNAVKSVTDFWSVRTANSWKTIIVECLIDVSDLNVMDTVNVDLFGHVVNTNGTITSVEHSTDTPSVILEIELACKVGSTTEDPNYWVLGSATCPAATGTQIDYEVPIDDSCPVYSQAQETPRPIYYIKMRPPFPPAKLKRFENFTLNFGIYVMYKNEDILVERNANVAVKIYTSNPNDSLYQRPNDTDPTLANFVAGELSITTQLKGGQYIGIVRVSMTPEDTTIVGGIITRLKDK